MQTGSVCSDACGTRSQNLVGWGYLKSTSFSGQPDKCASQIFVSIRSSHFRCAMKSATFHPQSVRDLVWGERRDLPLLISCIWAVGRRRPPLCRGCAPATPRPCSPPCPFLPSNASSQPCLPPICSLNSINTDHSERTIYNGTEARLYSLRRRSCRPSGSSKTRAIVSKSECTSGASLRLSASPVAIKSPAS